ncbi:cyclophilin-like fold protein [Methylobacterium sp. ARG-1]|uniref:cyclophilin-like fold protein n=1 Tax=Methylobacterium sp. ARG-1 TaxID=1692501 RepID=UPI000B266D1E|nr:cyclophilin-like fold protein [Methylobacterium sp. ARG-1]
MDTVKQQQRKLLLRTFQLAAAVLAILAGGPAMAQERIRISSEWGNVTAELAENEAARSLTRMLPLTIEMRDHIRQEKTGNLPSPLPEVKRQQDFAAGTLGLWGPDDFVIYYKKGRVPQPGITILGDVKGDVSIFDRPGPSPFAWKR